MAESEFSFPTAPSFTESAFPPPPVRGSKSVDAYLRDVERYLQSQLVGLTEMQATLTEGWVVDGLRVTSITADKVFANSIITETLFLGSSGNGSIALQASPIKIIIKDENGTNRVELGDFGTTNADWGIRVMDSAGILKFQSSIVTFIDGAIITNATIQDAKIVDLNGSKLFDGSVADAKVTSLSASKITVGTLIVDGSPAISVVSSGALVFSSGGDIIMRASGTNFSYIIFQNSSSVQQGALQLTTSGLTLTSSGTVPINIVAGSGQLSLTNTGTIAIGGGSTSLIRIGITNTTDVIIAAGVASSIFPDAGGTRNLGSSTLDWGTIFVGTVSHAGNLTLTTTSSGGITLTPAANLLLDPTGSIVFASNVSMSAHNTITMGSSGARLAGIWSVLVNGSDFCFDDDARLVEGYRVYSWMRPGDAWMFMSPEWEPLMMITKSGDLVMKGNIRGARCVTEGDRAVFPRPDVEKQRAQEAPNES